MNRNVSKQLTNETFHDVPNIGARNTTSTSNSNSSNSPLLGTTVNFEETIGTVLGGFGIVIILVFYIWWERRDNIKRKEKDLEETRKEEMKRKFLKDHMNIEIIVPTPYIDDEEAQQKATIFKSEEDGDEYYSTTDDSLEDHSQSVIEKSSSCSNKAQLQDVMCPICHEEFQDGDELASSRNEDCCHTAFHSECIISWLMADHKDCPICRSEFIVENTENED